jgi:uncharacterized membrane protein
VELSYSEKFLGCVGIIVELILLLLFIIVEEFVDIRNRKASLTTTALCCCCAITCSKIPLSLRVGNNNKKIAIGSKADKNNTLL